MIRLALLAFVWSAAFGVHAQPEILGRWTTVDDNTHKPRSVVEISMNAGVLTGRIVDLYDKSKLKNLCGKCPGDRHDQPLIGLEIIRDMRLDDDEWAGGTILDPETGKVYDCKLWIEDGFLKVRGYVAFFYRTQLWVR